MTTWKLLNTGLNSAAYNMALDEELLSRAQQGYTVPVLRFYAWRPAAVSIGRFQTLVNAVDEAACQRRGIDVVRRITGGRAVLHYQELTYSVVARTDDPLFPPDVLGTYKVIAECLVAGLANLGLRAEMVRRGGKHAESVQKRNKNPSCFSSPSWYEIMVNDRKIIGSAQRRLSHAFLQHGSVLIEHDASLENEVIPGPGAALAATSLKHELGTTVERTEIEKAFAAGFSEKLKISFST